MRYSHHFTVAAPLDEVAQFHRYSASMAEITPPPILVRMHAAPDVLQDGDEMSFTLWTGPIPIRWIARIEQVEPTGFIDRQLAGPFARWVHRHIFVPNGDDSTTVIDVVGAELHRDPFWRTVGLSMWAGLPMLFAYRGWKTKRTLERDATTMVDGSSDSRVRNLAQ